MCNHAQPQSASYDECTPHSLYEVGCTAVG